MNKDPGGIQPGGIDSAKHEMVAPKARPGRPTTAKDADTYALSLLKQAHTWEQFVGFRSNLNTAAKLHFKATKGYKFSVNTAENVSRYVAITEKWLEKISHEEFNALGEEQEPGVKPGWEKLNSTDMYPHLFRALSDSNSPPAPRQLTMPELEFLKKHHLPSEAKELGEISARINGIIRNLNKTKRHKQGKKRRTPPKKAKPNSPPAPRVEPISQPPPLVFYQAKLKPPPAPQVEPISQPPNSPTLEAEPISQPPNSPTLEAEPISQPPNSLEAEPSQPTTNELRLPLPTASDRCQPLPTTFDLCQPLPTTSDRCQPLPTTSDRCQPLPTTSDHIEPLSTTFNVESLAGTANKSKT